MNLVLYKHHIYLSVLCYDSRTKPIHDKFQKTLLGNWCQRGRERSHQSLIISIGGERILRGREFLNEKEVSHQRPRMLGVQEERSCMSLRGERHVHIWLFAFALFSLLWFSVPYLLPVSQARFRRSKISKGRKSLNWLHIFTFGDMSISNRVLSTHSLHVIPVMVLLWFLCLLWLVDVSVLSNLVYLGSFLLSQLKTIR